MLFRGHPDVGMMYPDGSLTFDIGELVEAHGAHSTLAFAQSACESPWP